MSKIMSYCLSDEIELEIRVETNNEIIHAYDEVTIRFLWNGSKYLLYKDFAIEAFRIIAYQFEKAIKNELIFSSDKYPKGVGYEWAIISHEIAEGNFEIEDSTEKYALWSVPARLGEASWLYNMDGQIYMEISPYYLWDYNEPEGVEIVQSFEEFTKSYKKIACIKIKKYVAQKILSETNQILDHIVY